MRDPSAAAAQGGRTVPDGGEEVLRLVRATIERFLRWRDEDLASLTAGREPPHAALYPSRSVKAVRPPKDGGGHEVEG